MHLHRNDQGSRETKHQLTQVLLSHRFLKNENSFDLCDCKHLSSYMVFSLLESRKESALRGALPQMVKQCYKVHKGTQSQLVSITLITGSCNP